MTPSATERVGPTRVAIVLAGGAARRFGSDKLAVDVGGATLLDTALAGLPAEVDVIVVGPQRRVSRAVSFVREDPPGGGPAAALVAGLRAALATSAPVVWVMPGDAPGAGRSAAELDLGLADGAAVVAVDAEDQLQPLQLALDRTAAEQLVRLSGARAGHGVSARALVTALEPPAVRRRLEPAGHLDIDTREQLRDYRRRHLRNDDGA